MLILFIYTLCQARPGLCSLEQHFTPCSWLNSDGVMCYVVVCWVGLLLKDFRFLYSHFIIVTKHDIVIFSGDFYIFFQLVMRL